MRGGPKSFGNERPIRHCMLAAAIVNGLPNDAPYPQIVSVRMPPGRCGAGPARAKICWLRNNTCAVGSLGNWCRHPRNGFTPMTRCHQVCVSAARDFGPTMPAVSSTVFNPRPSSNGTCNAIPAFSHPA